MPEMPGTFRPPHAPPPAERVRLADRARGTARERGYNSRWDRASRSYLDRNPLCLACKAAGITARSTVTDHVIPHRGDRALFWDTTNWQPSCDFHHNVVKQRLEADWDAGRITDADLLLTSASALALAERLRK